MPYILKPCWFLLSFATSLLGLAGLLGLGILSGCSQESSIRQYTVENIPSTAKPETSAAAEQKEAWFFKLTGPADDVLKQIVPFSQIMKSLNFDGNGRPQYDIPPGWNVSSGPPPRYQTLKFSEATPPLEVTVSSLPGPRSDYAEYLLSNVNRWRQQLGLDPYQNDDWLEKSRSSGELMVIPAESRLVVMVNLLGEMADQGPTRMLGAVVLLPPDDPGETTQASPPRAKSAIDYKLPEGWAPSAGNAMRLASFEVKHAKGVVDVSASRFPGGGDILANVNRWRGQVKLEDLSEEELKKNSQEMQIDGHSATYVSATGPEQTILAAIVPDGENKWFFKMQGPKEAVAAETAHFEEFLKSVKFEK